MNFFVNLFTKITVFFDVLSNYFSLGLASRLIIRMELKQLFEALVIILANHTDDAKLCQYLAQQLLKMMNFPLLSYLQSKPQNVVVLP